MRMTDKENQQKGVQFQFRKRYRRVDWKLLANVDIDRIIRDLDYQALQANIMNVAFCDTRGQDFIEVDEDYIKLYRLGQYTIEYLLHCQEYLSHGTVELETKLREAIRFRNEVKEKLETKQKELTDVKKESRKRKKMIAVYQNMLNTSGANGFHKCTHCEKAFVSSPFLSSHLERRHGIVSSPHHNSGDKLRIAHEEQEKELLLLDEKYRKLEHKLTEAQGAAEKALLLRDSVLEQQLAQEEAHKRWARDAQEKHAQEIEEVKAIYLKEAAEALEQKRIAELALVEAKKGIVSNLGALRDEKHEHDELRQEQLTQLEEQFEFKISQLQDEMELTARKLRNQEEEARIAAEEARNRERILVKQLSEKAEAEKRLHEILGSVERESAALAQINREKPDIRTTFSPKALAELSNEKRAQRAERGNDVEISREVMATQPVDIIIPAPRARRDIPTEKLGVPFQSKPYIKTYYDHPSSAITSARRELENDLSVRLLNVTANPDLENLNNEDFNNYKDQIAEERAKNKTTVEISKLDAEISELCARHGSSAVMGSASPRGSISSPTPAGLPPKSPSFKQSRESLLSRPNSSKRAKATPPQASPVPPAKREALSRDVIDPSRDVITPSSDFVTPQKDPKPRLRSPSYPDMKSDKLVASTPKIAARSADNIAPSHLYDRPEEEQDSFENDVSEIEMMEIEQPRERSRDMTREGSREVRIGDLESSESMEEEEEEEEFDDDDIFDGDAAATKTPGYSLRDPNYNPLDDDSEEECEIPSAPEAAPVVIRRSKKTYSTRDSGEDSIFSFDGWSKMKNRNSMSADDAQQKIPMGHVAKMRQAVDELNRAKRGGSLGGGVQPGTTLSPRAVETEGAVDYEGDLIEEDDFTVSSLSDRDISPMGMKVDIKRSSRNSNEQ